MKRTREKPRDHDTPTQFLVVEFQHRPHRWLPLCHADGRVATYDTVESALHALAGATRGAENKLAKMKTRTVLYQREAP